VTVSQKKDIHHHDAKESTRISLGITNRSIQCSGCTNVEEKCLNSRAKSASIDSRSYKCEQPWVAKGKTDRLQRIYVNTWKELVEELGYPEPRLHNDSSNKIQKGNFAAHSKKKQKLMMPPSVQDVDAYNLSCSTPTFVRSPLVASFLSDEPHPIKEITTTCVPAGTDTPSTLSRHSDLSPPLEGSFSNKEQEDHSKFNMLAKIKSLQDSSLPSIMALYKPPLQRML
jgi:hypothetical protein